MKTTKKEKLLNDVLHDEGYAAFRAGLFDDTLAELRRHRAARSRRRLLALAACLPIAAGLYALLAPPPPPASHPISTVALVRTVPLAENQIVTTAATMRTTPTTAQAKVVFVTTAAANIEIVQTAGESMQMLTDQQLLDLFRGQPVALVTINPGERRLVLLNDGEQPQ
jgi:hypothetical protein